MLSDDDLASLPAGFHDGELILDVAPVFVPLLNPAPYKGAWGGRGGAKSHFFAERLIKDSLYERGLLSVCVREVQRTLRDSSKRLIEAKLMALRLGEAQGFKVFADVIETPGDGIITFTGMQNHTAESVKSLAGFKRMWWDEAQNSSGTSLGILRPTFREDGAEMWFSWNPKSPPDPEHPLDSIDGLLRGEHTKDLGAVVVESQFYDNPWLTKRLIDEEAFDRLHRSPEDYAHIWKGAYLIRSEARVFKNWRVASFTSPANATFRLGADFGFAIDPSVLVRGFIGRWLNDDPNSGVAVADDTGRTLFIDQEAYRVGCDIDHTPALFAGNSPQPAGHPHHWQNPYGDPGIEGALRWEIIADSARPESISYLKRHGFKISAAVKGPGSVEEGIEFLKAYDIVVHSRCVHCADEFTFYSFKTDKFTGRILPVLQDKKNHVIDGIRYMVEPIRRGRRGFFS